jgi:hypothetical protein
VFRVDLATALELRGGPFLPEPGTTIDDYVARMTEA